MDNDIIEAVYDLLIEYDEDSYTKNKTKNEIKENMEEIKWKLRLQKTKQQA